MERLSNIRIHTLCKSFPTVDTLVVVGVKVVNNHIVIVADDDTTYDLGVVSAANLVANTPVDSPCEKGGNVARSNVLATLLRGIDGKDGKTPDMSDYYDKNTVEQKLSEKEDVITDLDAIRDGANKGSTAVQPSSLAKVATSGSYTDLKNKPSIPAEVTEATVSSWGFTKNKGTITEVKMNGVSKGTNGIVDLGTVITEHQDISGKQDEITDLDDIRRGAGKGDTSVQGVFVGITPLTPDGKGNITLPKIPAETDIAIMGFTKNKGTVTGVMINGESKSPNSAGIVDLGEIKVDEAKFANDLTGVVEATPEMFTFRPSAGDKSVRDESAVIRRIKGNTSVWGQLVTTFEEIAEQRASQFNYLGSGVFEVLNDRRGDNLTLSVGKASDRAIPGHKYLFYINAEGIYKYNFYAGFSSYARMSGNWKIDTCVSSSLFYFYPFETSNTIVPKGTSCTIREMLLFDLTDIFGAGNEPTTYEEFRQYYPDAYYPYCAPEIRSMRATGIETIGFNAFNGEYAKVIGGQAYYLGGAIDTAHFATKIGGELEEITIPEDRLYTPSENGYIYATGSGICINLSHSGVRNGEYKPYEKNTLLLPEIAKYFPNGMHGIGDVFDEINEEMAIQRCDVRAYEEGDENNAEVKTDKITTVYKLSESIHTPIDELLQLDYKVDDFGTEKMLSNAPSAPFKADIVYQFNAEGRIRDNSRNIEKLEDKVKSIAEGSLDTNALNGATAQLKSDIIKEYLNVKPTVRIFHSTDPNKSSIYAYHPYLNEFGDGELVVMRYGKTKMAKWVLDGEERNRKYVTKTGWRECLGAPTDLSGYIDENWKDARFTEPAKLHMGQNDYMAVLEEICARATYDKVGLVLDGGGVYEGLVSMAQLMARYGITAIGVLQGGFYDRWETYYLGDAETPPDYSIFGGKRDRVTLGVALRVLNPEFQKLLDEGILDADQFDKRRWYYDIDNDITIPKYFYSDVCEMYLSKGSMREMINLNLPRMPRLSLKG